MEPTVPLGGVYANTAYVWHTLDDFTIDFATRAVPEAVGFDDEHVGTVVARLKVAPSVIFGIARAIAYNVAEYEQRFGMLTPQPPDERGLT